MLRVGAVVPNASPLPVKEIHWEKFGFADELGGPAAFWFVWGNGTKKRELKESAKIRGYTVDTYDNAILEQVVESLKRKAKSDL